MKKIFKNFNKNLAITKTHSDNQITAIAKREPIIQVFNRISLNLIGRVRYNRRTERPKLATKQICYNQIGFKHSQIQCSFYLIELIPILVIL